MKSMMILYKTASLAHDEMQIKLIQEENTNIEKTQDTRLSTACFVDYRMLTSVIEQKR
jgi:hypothetical protein